MTAFNPSTDLPSSINTLESLAAWVLYALGTVNPEKSVLEDVNRAEFVAQIGLIKAADQSQRLVGRISLPLDASYATDNSKKLWMHTQELSSTELPAGFKSN